MIRGITSNSSRTGEDGGHEGLVGGGHGGLEGDGDGDMGRW